MDVATSLRFLLQNVYPYVVIAFHHCLGNVTQFRYIQTVNKSIPVTNDRMRDAKKN